MDIDDEETILFIEILNLIENVPNREFWVHPFNEQRSTKPIKAFINELRQYPDKFYNFVRMSPNVFDYILQICKAKLAKSETNFRKPIIPEERLFITLRYLAVGGYFVNLHFQFRIGVSTVRQIVLETCDIIWQNLSIIYMKPPTTDDWINISEVFKNYWNFPNCVGCVDGKHIRIEKPRGAGSQYFNYKHYNSIHLQGVVDGYGNFIAVDIGDYGRSSDGGVFQYSSFGRRFSDRELDLPPPQRISSNIGYKFPFVFVADEAYPFKPNLMKPFPQRSLSIEKRIFNYRLSRARRLVECAFGMMCKKFRVMENASLLEPEK